MIHSGAAEGWALRGCLYLSAIFFILSDSLGPFCSPVRTLGLELPSSVAHFLWLCPCSGPHGRKTKKKAVRFNPPTWDHSSFDQSGETPLPQSFRCLGAPAATDVTVTTATAAELPGVWGTRRQKKKTRFPPPFLMLDFPLPLLEAELESFCWRSFSSPQCPFWIWGCLVSMLGIPEGKMRHSLPVQWDFKFWLSSPVCLLFVTF